MTHRDKWVNINHCHEAHCHVLRVSLESQMSQFVDIYKKRTNACFTVDGHSGRMHLTVEQADLTNDNEEKPAENRHNYTRLFPDNCHLDNYSKEPPSFVRALYREEAHK